MRCFCLFLTEQRRLSEVPRPALRYYHAWTQACRSATPSHPLSQKTPPLQPSFIKPCALHGGPYSHLLQEVIQTKHDAEQQQLRATIQYLLGLGAPDKPSPGDNANRTSEVFAADADAHRTGKMKAALRTLHQLATPLNRKEGFSGLSTYCFDRPVGHVEVLPVVGYVYEALQLCGYDAEAWWKGYYHRFVRPTLPSSNQRGADAEKPSPRFPLQKRDDSQNASSDAAPPLCWERPRARRTTRSNEHARNLADDPMYAAPIPFTDGRGVRVLDSGASAVAMGATTPYWIPLGLLFHLPFFPVPLPASTRQNAGIDDCLTDDVEEEPEGEGDFGDGEYASASDYSGRDYKGREESTCFILKAQAPCQRGTSHENGAASGPNLAIWSVNNQSASSPLLTTTDSEWMHPFYNELFNATRTSCTTEATDALKAWYMGKRAQCPLVAPWSVVPLLASGSASSSVDVSSESATRNPVSENTRQHSTGSLGTPRAGAARWMHASPSTSSPSPYWPDPVTVLQLEEGYLKFLTLFWARKLVVMQNLARPYFFPFTAYPYLFAQMKEVWAEKGGTNKHRREHDLAGGMKTKGFAPFGVSFDNASNKRDTLLSRQGERPIHPFTASLQQQPFSLKSSAQECGTPLPPGHPLAVLHANWSDRGVTYFGTKYIPVSCTTLSCLFDSTTCQQHAIPLDVYGGISRYALTITRHRQQRHAPHLKDNVEVTSRHYNHLTTSSSGQELQGKEGVSCSLDGSAGTSSSKSRGRQPRTVKTRGTDAPPMSPTTLRSPWMERLRKIQQEQLSSSAFPPKATTSESIFDMRNAQQNNYFLFHSPYWVEVTDIYERWGVHVAPGVVPLSTGFGILVNAEQTTDASRFSPATCVPHLQQQILFSDSLFDCPWTLSQQLLRVTAPETQPRRRGARAVVTWTYATLKARAAAAQRVSNLWIADETVRKLGWTLRPVPCCTTRHTAASSQDEARAGVETILHAEVPVQMLHSKQLRLRLEEATAAAQSASSAPSPTSRAIIGGKTSPNIFAHPSEQPPTSSEQQVARQHVKEKASVTVFHSSCVVEQAQLTFLATFAPLVLFLAAPMVTEDDLRRDADRRSIPFVPMHLPTVVERLNAILCQANTSAASAESKGGAEMDDFACAAPSQPSPLVTHTKQMLNQYRKAVRLAQRAGDTDVQRYLRVAYAKRWRYAAIWRGVKLSRASRLDLAALALRRGYSPANAQSWVALDFLRSETRVRPVLRLADQPSQQNAELNERVYPPRGVQTEEAPDNVSDGTAASALTAIEVEAFTQLHPTDREGRVDDSALASIMDHASDAYEVESSPAEKFTRIKITLVNYDELDWPADIAQVNRFMWLSKSM